MQTGYFGVPNHTITLFMLCINVVVNNFNLILISLNSSNPELVKILGNDVVYHWYLILIETFVTLAVISLINVKSTSHGIIFIKFWSFGLTVLSIFLEMLAFLSFVILLYQSNAVYEFWENIHDDEKGFFTLIVVHLFVAVLSLCFFAFKLYTVHVLFNFGTAAENYIPHTDDDSNGDIEQCISRPVEQIVSYLSPPAYDSSSIEFALPASPTYSLPPRYEDVVQFKY